MKPINSNETLDLVDLPVGKRALGCKWVFKLKRDQNGEVTGNKAKLVAQGLGLPTIRYVGLWPGKQHSVH